MTLKADEFIRRFLLHVLPARYVRIRHFGLLANRRRKDHIASCREFLGTGKTVIKENIRQETWQEQLLRICGIDVTILSRMSERKDVQDSAVTALSVQQPTGVIQMSIVHNVKTMSPASCEKNVLLRHTLLLPKIVHSYPSRSSVGQSITMLAPMTDQYRYKRCNKALYSPPCR